MKDFAEYMVLSFAIIAVAALGAAVRHLWAAHELRSLERERDRYFKQLRDN